MSSTEADFCNLTSLLLDLVLWEVQMMMVEELHYGVKTAAMSAAGLNEASV